MIIIYKNSILVLERNYDYFCGSFSISWEQRKLGDETTEIVAGGDIDKSLVVENGKYPVYANALTNDGIIAFYASAYRIAAPAVTVTGRGEIGRAKARKVNFTPVVRLLSIKTVHNEDFLENLINTYQFAVESTGVPQLTVPQLSNFELNFPINIAEEKKIGELFVKIDNLITLHQCKEAALWKMFWLINSMVFLSCNTTTWEQCKLGEYIETSTEKNTENMYGIDDVLSVSGDFGVVNQIEFQGRSFAGASVTNYGVLHTGEVVYTKSPLKAAPYGIIKTNKGKTGIVSVLYGIYRAKRDVCTELFQTYFEQDARLNNYLRPLVNKGAKNTLLISDDDALNGDIVFPQSEDEQRRIYKVFSELDNLITLHQRNIKNIRR